MCDILCLQRGSAGGEGSEGSLDGGAERNLAAQVEGSRLAGLLGHGRLPRPYVRGRLGACLQQGEVRHYDGPREQEQQGKKSCQLTCRVDMAAGPKEAVQSLPDTFACMLTLLFVFGIERLVQTHQCGSF